MVAPAKRNRDRAPTSPGELLREEVLPALGKSKSELARLLGISRQTFYDILNEKQPITPRMAVRLGKLLGNGPDLWLAMQAKRDLWEAEKAVDVSRIKTLRLAS